MKTGMATGVLLAFAGVAAAAPPVEHEGTIRGTLVGRIEVYQAEGALHAAFADNRADGTAVLTRGGRSFTLRGKWSACEHGETASYCQLAGSSSVYRFAGATMTREDRSQPTALLAATNRGYAARVRTATGDVLVHRAGGADRVLAAGTVTAAWSSGDDVSYRANASTLRIISLVDGKALDVKSTTAISRNVERASSGASSDGYSCFLVSQHCEDTALGQGCFVDEYLCTCNNTQPCTFGPSYTTKAVRCPDPRKDEPLCGADPCVGAMAMFDDIVTRTELCAGASLSFECDLGAPGTGPCFSLPPLDTPTTAPPDVQVTVGTVTFAGMTLVAGTPVYATSSAGGDVYLVLE